MDESPITLATMEVRPEEEVHHGRDPHLLDVAPGMMFWTWATFLLVSYFLYKFAWKPILSGLDKREAYLRDSIQNAETLEGELAALEDTRKRMLAKTDEEVKIEMAKARKLAAESARGIEKKARQEAVILHENALSEIRLAEKKAKVDLRIHTVDTAMALAEHILDEQLDEAAHQALTDKLLKSL